MRACFFFIWKLYYLKFREIKRKIKCQILSSFKFKQKNYGVNILMGFFKKKALNFIWLNEQINIQTHAYARIIFFLVCAPLDTVILYFGLLRLSMRQIVSQKLLNLLILISCLSRSYRLAVSKLSIHKTTKKNT